MVCGIEGSERRRNWFGHETYRSLVFFLTFVLCSCVLGRGGAFGGAKGHARHVRDIYRDSGRGYGAKL